MNEHVLVDTQPFKKSDTVDFPLDLVHFLLIFAAHIDIQVTDGDCRGSPVKSAFPCSDAGDSSVHAQVSSASVRSARRSSSFCFSADSQ